MTIDLERTDTKVVLVLGGAGLAAPENSPDARQQLPPEEWLSDIVSGPRFEAREPFALRGHDREVLASVASPRPLAGTQIRSLMDRTLWPRFGETTLKAPHVIQWLSDNGPQYTATATVLYAHELGLVPLTTPAYSPQMAWPRCRSAGCLDRPRAGQRLDRGLQPTRRSGCGARPTTRRR